MKSLTCTWKTGTRTLTSIVALGALLTHASTAAAEIADQGSAPAESKEEKTVVRNDIAPLVLAGWGEGIGAGLQLDGSIFALRGSFAYAPLPAVIGEEGESQDFELMQSYQVNTDLLLFAWAPSARSRIGFSGGYRYNSVLGHGASWGLQVEADVAEHAILLLSLSTSYFPNGRERALDALGNPEPQVHFPFGANFASGVGVGVRFPI